MKTQQVRLIDVFLLGPFLIWTGTRARTSTERTVLILSGAATVLYNWRNYAALESRKVEEIRRLK